jgi:hypothetical protein
MSHQHLSDKMSFQKTIDSASFRRTNWRAPKLPETSHFLVADSPDRPESPGTTPCSKPSSIQNPDQKGFFLKY